MNYILTQDFDIATNKYNSFNMYTYLIAVASNNSKLQL